MSVGDLLRMANNKIPQKSGYYITPVHPVTVANGLRDGWLKKRENGCYEVISKEDRNEKL